MNGWNGFKIKPGTVGVLADPEGGERRVTVEVQGDFMSVNINTGTIWHCLLYRGDQPLAAGAGRTKHLAWESARTIAETISGEPLQYVRTPSGWVPKP